MTGTNTFQNPVQRAALADPFVLKHNGIYYCYGTPPAGSVPVFTSTDLVEWEPAGSALAASGEGKIHWAPEVAYDNGTFYLYYSVGGSEGEGHQLRVATASDPGGPFADLGIVLDPDDPFTIDAHPFRDEDGTWYLFYCRDFLEGERVGTGIVVDRMVDMVALAGERATVVRPYEDWHIYERDRQWYGRTWDWYTVEGPLVRKHEGRYWCFFSGGAWRAENYGVSCAVADHPLGPYVPRHAVDGADILRTVPGRVLGPGHASVVLAPDNVSEFLVYHAWDADLTDRYMCIDPLRWTAEGPSSPGPTAGGPAPPRPEVRHLFGGRRRPLDASDWKIDGGSWEVGQGEAVQSDEEAAAANAVLIGAPSGDQLVEVNLALRCEAAAGSAYGVTLAGLEEDKLSIELVVGEAALRWRSWRGHEIRDAGHVGRLRGDFDHGAFHQLTLMRKGPSVEVRLDGSPFGTTADPGGPIGLFTARSRAAFAGVSVTRARRTP